MEHSDEIDWNIVDYIRAPGIHLEGSIEREGYGKGNVSNSTLTFRKKEHMRKEHKKKKIKKTPSRARSALNADRISEMKWKPTIYKEVKKDCPLSLNRILLANNIYGAVRPSRNSKLNQASNDIESVNVVYRGKKCAAIFTCSWQHRSGRWKIQLVRTLNTTMKASRKPFHPPPHQVHLLILIKLHTPHSMSKKLLFMKLVIGQTWNQLLFVLSWKTNKCITDIHRFSTLGPFIGRFFAR